eukprot:2169728-Pleurochrysis_carterae.AAC.3
MCDSVHVQNEYECLTSRIDKLNSISHSLLKSHHLLLVFPKLKPYFRPALLSCTKVTPVATCALAGHSSNQSVRDERAVELSRRHFIGLLSCRRLLCWALPVRDLGLGMLLRQGVLLGVPHAPLFMTFAAADNAPL